MGYLRIVTHPALLPRPLAPAEAIANVSALRAAHVRTPGEGDLGAGRPHNDPDRANDMPDAPTSRR
jgi:hypothetical protein